MDELQISGKRFISSRRIAKDNGYHSDYIGQLIRGGKIKGQKVGRTWYVEESSFKGYLGQEMKPAIQDAAIAEEIKTAPEETPVVAEAVVKKEEEQKEEKIPVHIAVEEKKEVAVPTVVSLRKAETVSGGLKYFADDEPLLPEISNEREVSRIDPISVEEQTDPEIKIQSAVMAPRLGAGRILFGLAATGVVVFVFSAALSSAMFEKISIEAGNPASVGYSMQW